jgi:hypothetical protein
MPINGRHYDWEDVSITMPGGTLIDVLEISYDDEKEIKEVYGKGGMPRGYRRGNYQASGKLSMHREEFNRMIAIVGSYEAPPVPIAVRWANEDQGQSLDILKDCKFNKRSFGAQQGGTDMKVDLEFRILGGVFPNGLPPQTLV